MGYYHLVQHHCNNIVVMTTNASTSTIYNTIVHNICGPDVIIMIGLILVTVPNVILLLSWYFYFGLILVMAPNAFPGCLFINLLSAHTVFERSIWNFF